jgi:hypothetical protein
MNYFTGTFPKLNNNDLPIIGGHHLHNYQQQLRTHPNITGLLYTHLHINQTCCQKHNLTFEQPEWYLNF